MSESAPPPAAPPSAAPHPALRIAARFGPGLAVSGVIAMAATFLSEHYGGPAMLFALLLGMAFHFLSLEGRCAAGIDFATRTVLRTGVALLGLRITVDQLAALGWLAPTVMLAAVVATILFGLAVARLFRLPSAFGVLTGGAVAICGASAALAISAVLPKHPHSERDTILAVIGVTTLSTAAMVIYPALLRSLGIADHDAGFFLGATIHDVAQVVGAGYSISATAGDVATITKLMRVAFLVPVVAALALAYGGSNGAGRGRGLRLPWFLVAFVVLAGINSAGWAPAPVVGVLNEVSRWCLVTAIAALGMKTSLAALSVVGWRPVALMVTETLLLFAIALTLIL